MTDQADRLSDRHFKLLTDMAIILLRMSSDLRKIIESLDKFLKEIGDKK